MKAKPLSVLVLTSSTLSARARRREAVSLSLSLPRGGYTTAMSDHVQSWVGGESGAFESDDVLAFTGAVDLVRGPVQRRRQGRVEDIRLRAAPDRHLGCDVEPGRVGGRGHADRAQPGVIADGHVSAQGCAPHA